MPNGDRWEQQWLVPSNSGSKEHKVSKDHEGSFFCDCWPFRKNRTCKHIDVVKSGGGTPLDSPALPEPPLQFWEIDKVTPEISDGQIEFLKVPLMPFGESHAHFAYTIFYDLMFYGVKWATIREQYSVVTGGISEADVRNAIRQRGRCVRGAWQPSPDGKGGDWGPYVVTHKDPPRPLELQTYKIVSPDGEETLRCSECGWKSSELYVIAHSAAEAAQHEDALCSDCFCGDVRDDCPVVVRTDT